jgi:hypothetical protein
VAAQVAVSRPTVELADGTTRGGVTADDTFLVLARFAAGGWRRSAACRSPTTPSA